MIRSFKKQIAGLLVCILAIAPGMALAYPNGTVSLMVPYPAGGPSDVIARIFNTRLSKQLNTPVIVENIGGVSGALAAQKMLGMPANGQMLYQASPNEVILSPLANAAVKFNAEDFQLIQLISYGPLVIVARKDLPANTSDELVTLARKSSSGAALAYGSVGIGSFYHVVAEHMGQTIGAKMNHVPYKGAAPLLQDIAVGSVDFAILPHFAAIDGLVEQGRVKVIAQLGAQRAETLPKLPTVSEGKLLKNFSFTIWTGYMVKKGTPTNVISILQKAIHTTLADPQVRESLKIQSQLTAKPMSLEESEKFYNAEIAQYRKIAKAVGIERQ
ncbi:MAG: tripartite tricarboxylate transporter substrate binding protein [Burkholderiaceae bacterium]|nr:tripartite tricarboxylate transporter substrate binding protein [Burkholderiaceae bacterium]